MKLSRFVTPLDVGSLVRGLRRPLRLLGWVLAPPLAVALISGEWSQAFVFAALGASALVLGYQRTRPAMSAMTPREIRVLSAAAYLGFALVGALAYLPEASVIDGFFESMSGFTTTGLTVLDVENLPRSLLFFRSYSQWIGGGGILVLVIVFLPGPRSVLVRLYRAELSEENFLGNVRATTKLVLTIYGGLTGLGFLAFWMAGMPPFEAGLHALSTLSTGGMSPQAESIGHYDDVAIRGAVCVFMVVGATALPLYYRARVEGLKRFVRDAQLRTLVLLVAASSLFPVAFSSPSGEGDLFARLFHIVSAITTTGFNVTETRTWPEGLLLLGVVWMFLGGSAGSTAGGFKLIRLLLLLKVAHWVVKRTLLPAETEVPIRQSGHVVTDDDIKGVLGLLVLYLVLLAASTIALTAGGYAVVDSLFESASALGTVGLSTGVTSPAAPTWVKLILIIDMWAGRLEVLPLLALLYPGPWRRT